MTNAELENHLYQSILPEYGEREANAIRRFLFWPCTDIVPPNGC